MRSGGSPLAFRVVEDVSRLSAAVVGGPIFYGAKGSATGPFMRWIAASAGQVRCMAPGQVGSLPSMATQTVVSQAQADSGTATLLALAKVIAFSPPNHPDASALAAR